jgi:FKBP-type peptidyl-prolyl cis-trans isomerase
MKFNVIATVLLGVLVATVSCNSQVSTDKQITMKTQIDSVSYALGVNIGSSIKTQFKDIDLNILAAAIKDAYAGKEMIANEECIPILRTYSVSAQKKIADENMAVGQKFLAENAKRSEVKTTASGLQYEIVKAGNGPIPTESDRITVHYHGTLIDGTVFDSSIERGQPATFIVTQVIAGWTEALKMMPVGSKWKVYVPSDLAYGVRGNGPDIMPNSTLIFDMELLGIVGN